MGLYYLSAGLKKQCLLHCDFSMYESFNFVNILKKHNTSSLELMDSINQ